MTEVPAATQTLAIIKYLATQAGPVRASTISRALDIPRSSTYHLLQVLLVEGFVVHYSEASSYGLSALLSELGAAHLGTNRLDLLGRPLLARLAKRAGLPAVAQLVVLHGREVAYVVKEVGFRAPAVVTGTGVSLPAHLTATGRAMLAQLPRQQLRALYPTSDTLITRNGTGPQTMSELDRILHETRGRGWAIESGEVTEGYTSLAAAALDHNGYPACAVGLTMRSTSLDVTLWPELGRAVQDTARALSQRLRRRAGAPERPTAGA